jgi:HPt (histidine-containing phosphotransfer) domain-containing protein
MVLMDLRLPDANGFETAERLRAREKETGAHLPLIALTAYAMREDRERCLRAGLDDYVPKPVRAEELYAAIERVAARFGIEPRPERPAESPAPVIDEPALMAGIRGDEKLLRELIDLFLEDSAAMLSEMEEAIDGGDAPRLASSAHAFIGSLGNFAARRAFTRARELERAGREGDLEAARGLFPRLVEDTRHLEEALREMRKRPSRNP